VRHSTQIKSEVEESQVRRYTVNSGQEKVVALSALGMAPATAAYPLALQLDIIPQHDEMLRQLWTSAAFAASRAALGRTSGRGKREYGLLDESSEMIVEREGYFV